MREKRKMEVSNFGVLAQIRSVGPNLNIVCDGIFNLDNEKLFTC